MPRPFLIQANNSEARMLRISKQRRISHTLFKVRSDGSRHYAWICGPVDVAANAGAGDHLKIFVDCNSIAMIMATKPNPHSSFFGQLDNPVSWLDFPVGPALRLSGLRNEWRNVAQHDCMLWLPLFESFKLSLNPRILVLPLKLCLRRIHIELRVQNHEVYSPDPKRKIVIAPSRPVQIQFIWSWNLPDVVIAWN
eukprot:Skav206168  [mRNA]  locus=scaffold1545:314756:318148:+ [translate_table: standard]